MHTSHAWRGGGNDSPTTLMFPQRQRGETTNSMWLLWTALVIVLSHLSCPLIHPVGAITIQTAHLQQVNV